MMRMKFFFPFDNAVSQKGKKTLLQLNENIYGDLPLRLLLQIPKRNNPGFKSGRTSKF